MNEAEKFICDYMVAFFEEKFDKITLDLADSNLPTDKKGFLKCIKTNPQDAIWSLTECARWGMDKEYFADLYLREYDEDEFSILKFGDKYIKLTVDKQHVYHVRFVEPKEKVVKYFD